MTAGNEVHWSEGLFLRPHHLQVAERLRAEALGRAVSLVQPFFWGLVRVDLALEQLENFTFEVRSVELRLKDGTLLTFPGGARLAPRPFKAELDQAGGHLDVYLGVPVYRESGGNAPVPGERASASERRYAVEALSVPDENTGANPQPVDVRRLNARILFGTEPRDGYDCLLIAGLSRSGHGRNLPALSAETIPSVTEIGAWTPLATLCQSIANRVEAKYRLLLSETPERAPSGFDALLKLQTLSPFVFLLHQLTRNPRLHPFPVYLELCRLAGVLSVFDDGQHHRLPIYDHDRLGPCFFELDRYLGQLLERVAVTRYQRLDFGVRGDLLVTELPAEWTRADTELYLCVDTELGKTGVDAKVSQMKVGSVRDIPALIRDRLPGLDLARTARPPGLPVRDGLYYLMLEKAGLHWSRVQQDQILAIAGGLDAKIRGWSLYMVGKGGGAVG